MRGSSAHTRPAPKGPVGNREAKTLRIGGGRALRESRRTGPYVSFPCVREVRCCGGFRNSPNPPTGWGVYAIDVCHSRDTLEKQPFGREHQRLFMEKALKYLI